MSYGPVSPRIVQELAGSMYTLVMINSVSPSVDVMVNSSK